MKFPKIGKVLDKLPNNISRPIGRAGLQTQKHSPTILFGVGVTGIVATVVLASRATLKLQDILDEADEKIEKIELVESSDSEKWTDKDLHEAKFSVKAGIAVDILKLYGPAVIIGVASVCALTGSHVILNKRNAAITAAYKVLEKGFEEYRDRVKEELGIEKDLEYRYGSLERDVVVDTDEGPVVERIRSYGKPSIYAREFNEYCRPWSRAPMDNSIFLSTAQNWCNDKLKSQGHLFLNEVYDMLGMDRTPEGAVVGWIYDKAKDNGGGNGDGYITFCIHNPDVNPPDVANDFVRGRENRILVDFNVDGVMWNLI